MGDRSKRLIVDFWRVNLVFREQVIGLELKKAESGWTFKAACCLTIGAAGSRWIVDRFPVSAQATLLGLTKLHRRLALDMIPELYQHVIPKKIGAQYECAASIHVGDEQAEVIGRTLEKTRRKFGIADKTTL